MDFFRHYAIANSGTSVPLRFHSWAAVSLLAMVLGRRVYVDHGHFQLRPMMYICLVGDPNSGKSTAKDKAKEMFMDVFDGHPIGASVTTREQIVQRMSEDEGLRTFTDETGVVQEYKPLYFFINEFKNFLSVNPEGMIDFLTDIYDTKFFDSENLKRGLQPIINPCVNILACDTPETIITKFKLNLIGGGFLRRLFLIYEDQLPEKITFPVRTQAAIDSWQYCVNHLTKIKDLAGPMLWTPDAKTLLDKWYTSTPRSTDPVLSGYYGAKANLAQKIAMCFAVASEDPKLVFTKDLIQLSIEFLEDNEINLPKLTVAAGRNELAAYQQKLLSALDDNGGMMPEYVWHRLASGNMKEPEYIYVKKMFKDTLQIFERTSSANGVPVNMIMNEKCYHAAKKRGEVV